jgi:hypothetical protein
MAPRDDDKAMDGLLRRSLARDAAAADTCPEPDIFAAYYERALEPEEMARYELHFSQCARCREQLAAIFRAQSVMEVPSELEVMDAAEEEIPQATARRPAAATLPEERARVKMLDWRWLAPVAAAALVAVFIYGRNASHFGKPLTSGSEVAMTRAEGVPQAGPTEHESDAQHMTLPQQAPSKPAAKGIAGAPAVAGQKPQETARNVPQAPPPQSQLANRITALRSEHENRNDLRKRAAAQTTTNMEKQAPAAVDATSTAITGAGAALAMAAPSPAPAAAPPAPSAAASTKGETKEAAPRADTAVHKSVAGGRLKKQAGAAANAADNPSMKSSAFEKQPAALVVQTPDAGVQYRVVEVGVVERSDDGGASWQDQRVMANTEILAGAAPSVNVCWLVGRGGIVLMTTDGKNWKKIPSAADVDLVAVTAADATFATVVTADGRKFATQNGGTTWQLLK